MNWAILYLMVLLTLALTQAFAIVGGTYVSPKSSPNVSLIYMIGPDGVRRCTGVRVSPRFVLTAAHCVRPLESYRRINVGLWVQPSNRTITSRARSELFEIKAMNIKIRNASMPNSFPSLIANGFYSPQFVFVHRRNRTTSIIEEVSDKMATDFGLVFMRGAKGYPGIYPKIGSGEACTNTFLEVYGRGPIGKDTTHKINGKNTVVPEDNPLGHTFRIEPMSAATKAGSRYMTMLMLDDNTKTLQGDSGAPVFAKGTNELVGINVAHSVEASGTPLAVDFCNNKIKKDLCEVINTVHDKLKKSYPGAARELDGLINCSFSNQRGLSDKADSSKT